MGSRFLSRAACDNQWTSGSCALRMVRLTARFLSVNCPCSFNPKLTEIIELSGNAVPEIIQRGHQAVLSVVTSVSLLYNWKARDKWGLHFLIRGVTPVDRSCLPQRTGSMK